MLPPGSVTETEFLNLTYKQPENHDEVLWILGQYMEIVTKEAIAKDRIINPEELRGVLKCKLAEQEKRRVRRLNIQGLS